jgi:uncharacterized metal-binding protein YceD (DUF177 family)
MKIHTLQIPPEGKRIEGEDPREVLSLEDGLAEPCAPLAYTLDIGLSEGGVFATGTLRTAFKMSCVSCLESFEMPVVLENFACQADLEGREVVDLTEALREDIILALPAHPHCDWNGRNDCKGNPLPAAEVPAAENRREVWNALDRLKI